MSTTTFSTSIGYAPPDMGGRVKVYDGDGVVLSTTTYHDGNVFIVSTTENHEDGECFTTYDLKTGLIKEKRQDTWIDAGDWYDEHDESADWFVEHKDMMVPILVVTNHTHRGSEKWTFRCYTAEEQRNDTSIDQNGERSLHSRYHKCVFSDKSGCVKRTCWYNGEDLVRRELRTNTDCPFGPHYTITTFNRYKKLQSRCEWDLESDNPKFLTIIYARY